MASGFLRAGAVDDEYATVIRGHAKDDLPSDVCVGGEERAHEAPLPELRELHGLIHGAVGHHGVHRAERLDVMRLSARERLRRGEECDWKERTTLGVGPYDVEPVAAAEHELGSVANRVGRRAHVPNLRAAR